MNEQEKNQKLKKSIITLSIVCAVFILIALIFFLVSLNSNVSEFLSKTWSRFFTVVFGHITSLFGFSVFEWCAFLFVLTIITLLIVVFILLGKKRKMQAGKLAMQILASIVGIVCIYVSTVTVSYNRAVVPIDTIENSLVSEEMVLNTYNSYMKEFNEVANKVEKDEKGRSVSPYNHEELAEKVRNEHLRLDENYFGKYTTKPKYIVFSGIMSEFNILGITFTPFAEANVNKLAPFTDIAPTIAHELAHTKGVMRENDANLIAYYLLLTSEDDYLKYCGYLSTWSIMSTALIYSNNKDKIQNLPEVAVEDIKYVQAFWDQYDTLDKIGDFFNDIYLKLQGESGSDSYFEENEGDYDENTQEYSNVVYTDVQRMIIKIFSVDN